MTQAPADYSVATMQVTTTRAQAVFLRLGSRPIPRVTRIMQVVRSLGADCLFVGGRRSEGLPEWDTWDGARVQRIGRVFPLVNGARPLTYIAGVFGYWWAAFRLLMATRPALIHASDFEAGVPCVIAGRITGTPVIYNIHDNLSVRYALPAWARAGLNALEGLVVRSASVTLVPEPFRRDLLVSWAQERVHVVRNSPADPGYHEPPERTGARPKLLFAGWLDFDRGLAQIVSLAGEGKIDLVVAGEGDERVQRLMRETPNVDYRGFCDHATIMQLTADCDYVAAYYNPRRMINRYAASNKIAEALAIGRPVLINEELMVATRLIESGAAISVSYEEISRVAEAIGVMHPDGASYRTACEAARRLYETDYHESRVLESTLAALATAGVTGWR